jgi:hypothetical protein
MAFWRRVAYVKEKPVKAVKAPAPHALTPRKSKTKFPYYKNK